MVDTALDDDEGADDEDGDEEEGTAAGGMVGKAGKAGRVGRAGKAGMLPRVEGRFRGVRDDEEADEA